MDKDKNAHKEDVADSVTELSAEPKESTQPEVTSVQAETGSPVEVSSKVPKSAGRFKRFLRTKKGKASIIFGVIVCIVAVLLAVPTTRYGMLGTVLKRSVHVKVVDASTQKPVSQATVAIAGKTVKTGSNGEATVDAVSVGEYTLKITKGYYKTSDIPYVVPVLGEGKKVDVFLTATGRQVTLKTTNKITGAVLAGVTITVNDTSAVTNDKGEASIVLPADKKSLRAAVHRDGYNEFETDVKITEQSNANAFSLTPAGSVFYLSKQTGKINVMKSSLDGSNPSIVVAGTGNESDSSTVLLAARDWNYLALSSKREAKKANQLYLVDTKSGALKVIDEGEASFDLVGWSNHRFVYLVTRNNFNPWDSQAKRLKSYDAETGKLTILDENIGTGVNYDNYQSENLQSAYIVEGKVVYAKFWSLGRFVAVPSDKKSAIMTVNPDGSGKQRVREFTMQHNISFNGKPYEPQGIYFRVNIDEAAATYYEYENNAVKSVTYTDDKFFNTPYSTYLVSPNGQKTLWYESRNGKNTLLVGDKNGQDGKTLAEQSEYKAYGWYTDQYILLSKNDSELYIASVEDVLTQPFKIANYHKPSLTFPGYGYGYGGNG